MSHKSYKWIILGLVLCLTILDNGFGAKWPDLPSGQPTQIWSQVHYDPQLTDPFFESNEWSYPDYDYKGIPYSNRPKDPPRLKHTAKCFSTSFSYNRHRVRFCEARLLDSNLIELFIHEDNPGFIDNLIVRIRDGMFMSQ